MNHEKPFDVEEAANTVVTDYSLLQVIEKRRSAEGCGCNRCITDYNDFIEWLDMGRGKLNEYLIPPGRDDESSIYDDEHPPDFDSGGLADWYARG